MKKIIIIATAVLAVGFVVPQALFAESNTTLVTSIANPFSNEVNDWKVELIPSETNLVKIQVFGMTTREMVTVVSSPESDYRLGLYIKGLVGDAPSFQPYLCSSDLAGVSTMPNGAGKFAIKCGIYVDKTRIADGMRLMMMVRKVRQGEHIVTIGGPELGVY